MTAILVKYCVVRITEKGNIKPVLLQDGPNDLYWTHDKSLADYTLEFIQRNHRDKTYRLLEV